MAKSEQVIDVDRLVEELKERVERRRGEGAYADRLPGLELVPVGGTPAQPPAAHGGPAPAAPPRVVFLPGDRYRSPRAVVGAVISFFRRLVLRLVHPAIDDVARQTDAALLALHARIQWAEEAIPAEARAREGVHRLAEHVERRLGDVEAAATELEESVREALDQMLERLEELAGGEADVRELVDDLRLRHGERLERVESASRAFETAAAETLRGLSDHLRELDARAGQAVAAKNA